MFYYPAQKQTASFCVQKSMSGQAAEDVRKLMTCKDKIEEEIKELVDVLRSVTNISNYYNFYVIITTYKSVITIGYPRPPEGSGAPNHHHSKTKLVVVLS